LKNIGWIICILLVGKSILISLIQN
jgi:hypothetical protein